MKATDLTGKIVEAGDIIAFGFDNGSTLALGKVTKITPKKVWFNPIFNAEVKENYTRCRDWTRVVKIENYNL